MFSTEYAVNGIMGVPHLRTLSMKPLILLVDDFDDAREIYSTYLEFNGYPVRCAADGAEALSLARAESPAVILLDVRMPGMTGTDVMRTLRADPSFAQVPIVALTAHALDDERVAALEAGFDAVISKPCLPDELLAVIEQLLAQWRLDAQPGA
jgi:two-component system cell cycle response regulator DivK